MRPGLIEVAPNYFVNAAGEVFRLRTDGKTSRLRGRINADGYRTVSIKVGGRFVARRVHSMVAAAFLGPRPDGMEVNHKDGNKLNNRPSNLEYLTHRQNVEHSVRMGLVSHGDRHTCAKLSSEVVRRLRELRDPSPETLNDLAYILGVHPSTILHARRGRYWRRATQPPEVRP